MTAARCALLLVASLASTAAFAQPSMGTMSPSSGTGGSQTFTFHASSPNGYAYIDSVYFLFNWSLDGAGGCWFEYSQTSNSLWIINNANTAFVGGYAPGTSNVLSNNQCSFNAASVSVSGSGNTLTLTVPLTFNSAFIGPQTVYGTVGDKGGVWSPYQQLGTWTAYAAPYTQLPSGLSVSPASGTGTSQLFTFHASDLNGAAYIPQVQIVINSSLNTANACYFEYSRAAAWIGLVNNANTGWAASDYLGNSSVLSNSQCSINMARSSASFSGNDLYLNVAITFASGFTGAKNVYELVYDHTAQSTGWTQVGTWTVGTSILGADSMSPPSGTGGTQTFTFTGSSQNGFGYIDSEYFLFNWALDGGGGCWFEYSQTTNSLWIINNASTAWVGGYAPGTNNVLSNAQCSFNAASVSVSGFSNTLAVTVPITFASAFIGSQQVYGTVLDKGGTWSPYQQLGTWTTYAAPYTQLPSGLSVLPSTGTGMSQTFNFHANDLNGAAYIPQVLVMVNSSVNTANACYFEYSRAAGWIGLYNNAGTAWAASDYLVNATVLSNSQCSNRHDHLDLVQSLMAATLTSDGLQDGESLEWQMVRPPLTGRPPGPTTLR